MEIVKAHTKQQGPSRPVFSASQCLLHRCCPVHLQQSLIFDGSVMFQSIFCSRSRKRCCMHVIRLYSHPRNVDIERLHHDY